MQQLLDLLHLVVVLGILIGLLPGLGFAAALVWDIWAGPSAQAAEARRREDAR